MHEYGTLAVEVVDGNPIAVLNRGSRILYAASLSSLVPPPADGELVTVIDHDDCEGAIVDVIWRGRHYDVRTDIWLVRRPNEHISDALDAAGLDETALLP